MKYKNDDIFHESLSGLDESEIEEISKEIPPLDSKAKKRILNSCLKKMNCEEMIENFEPEITVSGTEKIVNSRFKQFAATAAAFVLIAGGISGVALINKNLSGTVEHTSESSVSLIMTSDSTEKMVSKSNSENASIRTNKTNVSSASAINSETQTSAVEVETSVAVSQERRLTVKADPIDAPDVIQDNQPTAAHVDFPQKLVGIWKNSYRDEPNFISIDVNGNFSAYDKNGAESDSGMIKFSRVSDENNQIYILTAYDNTLNFELCICGDNYFHSVDSETPFYYERLSSEFGVPVIKDDGFCGKYDMLNVENGIEIVKTGDNLYSIELSFYRIAAFSDGIGSVDENGNLIFSTGSITGAPKISGEIIPWENGVYLKITKSEFDYIPPDTLPVEEWANYLYYKQ